MPNFFGIVCVMSEERERRERDLARFGQLVYERRTELGYTQEEITARGGPSDTTLTKIENGEWKPGRTTTLRNLDAALNWEPGSAAIALTGGEPTPIDPLDGIPAELRFTTNTGEPFSGVWNDNLEPLGQLALVADRMRAAATSLMQFTSADDVERILGRIEEVAELALELAEKAEGVAQRGVGSRARLAQMKAMLDLEADGHRDFLERAERAGDRIARVSPRAAVEPMAARNVGAKSNRQKQRDRDDRLGEESQIPDEEN